MLNNIPYELRALNQWVCWRYEEVDGRQTKVPYSAKSHHKASVTDPSHWSDFKTASGQANKYNGIGLVLTQSCGYSIIDLDNKPEHPCTPEQLERHNKIYEVFDSYAEYSTSRTGIHIIVKGSIPSGVHRDNVEVYSTGRYMICTGDILRNSPIKDHQALLTQLYGEMKPPESVELAEVVSHLTDQEVVEMAMRASNADKFNSLCAGHMEDYPSQSEADFALLSIIAYYTPDNEQVRRLFRMSALGQRTKANINNTYLNFALRKVRAQQPVPIDLTELVANAAKLKDDQNATPSPQPVGHQEVFQQPGVQPVPSPTQNQTANLEGLTLPPGLVGEIAQYIYQSSFMPIPEVALAAALSMFGSMVGRQFNINGQGLSQFIILLAETGKGKEGAATGIDRLFAAIRPQIPMVDEFRGPAAFASGPAVMRAISDQPSMLSIQGEFGFTINRLNNAKPGSPEASLKQALMDMYTKSGWFSTVQSTVYSDKEKNTSMVQAPNLNILGESTQTRFFEGLDITATEDGLVPRLLIIESRGDRPYPNRNHGGAPSKDLVQKIQTAVATSLAMKTNNQCTFIQMDQQAEEYYWKYTRANIDLLNNHKGDPVMCLWSRAAATTARVAALIAVGVNPHNPIVTMAEYSWAKGLVERSVHTLIDRFRGGDIGEGDSKQVSDLRKVISGYFAKASIPTDTVVPLQTYKDGLIPYSHLIKRTANLSSFKNDPLKSTGALKKSIQALLDTGELIEVSKQVTFEKYKSTARLFGITDHWRK